MKKIYLSLFALALTIGAMAQTVSIGSDLTTPSGSQYRSPWSPLYGYSYVQTIYLKSEINMAGMITKLTFDYSGTSLANSDNVTVWLGTVARSTFATASDWEPLSSLTQVFSGTVSYTSLPGPVTINLTTPYAYNNVGNLLIAVDENVDGFSTGSSFYTTDMGTGNTRTIYFNDDNAANNPNPSMPPTPSDGIRTRVANIQITLTQSMPVTVSGFTGEKNGNSNKLSWTTQTENNNKGFELQRSADGTNFTSVGFVASKAEKGNSTANLSYNYNDAGSASGSVYYRLKQVDLDGKSSFSKVVVVKGSNARFALGAIYPNPVKNALSLIVTAPAADKATIFISDISGKVVSKTSSNILVGDNKINVDPSRFAPGIYNVKVVLIDSKETVAAKFVKQ